MLPVASRVNKLGNLMCGLSQRVLPHRTGKDSIIFYYYLILVLRNELGMEGGHNQHLKNYLSTAIFLFQNV